MYQGHQELSGVSYVILRATTGRSQEPSVGESEPHLRVTVSGPSGTLRWPPTNSKCGWQGQIGVCVLVLIATQATLETRDVS